MPLMVLLSCYHNLWPGNPRLFSEGDQAYCTTCHKHRTVTSVGQTAW
jgi:hypothetical protein